MARCLGSRKAMAVPSWRQCGNSETGPLLLPGQASVTSAHALDCQDRDSAYPNSGSTALAPSHIEASWASHVHPCNGYPTHCSASSPASSRSMRGPMWLADFRAPVSLNPSCRVPPLLRRFLCDTVVAPPTDAKVGMDNCCCSALT